jgi:aminoglycoside phosphotransferase (APT) family kinase protein
MTTQGAREKRPPGDGELPTPRAVLEAGLGQWFGRPVRITVMTGRPLETSSHPIDRLRVRLDSGEQLAVIFKRPQPGDKLYGNEREVQIYRRLLAGGRFGAPALYASVYEEDRGRYWLFLEDVGQTTLDQAGMDAWLAATRCLARMHATYLGREEDLRALRCLGEHGADYYRMVARTARQYLHEAGARDALARFDDLTEDFDSLVVYLAAQPRTLVHGDIFAGNLVVQPGLRIRFLDWESAAVGLAAWDLVRLLDGWGPEKPKFVAAYLDEFARRAGAAIEEQAFRLTFMHCRVLNILWHLRWSVEACRDAAFVEGELNRLATLRQDLDRERRAHG